jgi:CheY-like chemotaxis protein
MFLDNGLILLGEDDGNDALLFELMWRRCGYNNRIEVAPTVDELRAYLEGLGRYGNREAFPLPCLVFLDGHIPPHDATVDAQWLQFLLKRDQIPLVVLTGDMNPKLEERARELGAVARILKPLTSQHIQELGSTLHKYRMQPRNAEVA